VERSKKVERAEIQLDLICVQVGRPDFGSVALSVHVRSLADLVIDQFKDNTAIPSPRLTQKSPPKIGILLSQSHWLDICPSLNISNI
jgi:hypothetical protein